MQKAGDDGLSYIEGDLTVTAGGTLAVDQGTLELEYGTDTLSGLITGPGALLIG